MNCEYIIWLLENGITTTSILLAGCIECAALHAPPTQQIHFPKKESIFRFSPFVGRSARVCTLEMCLNTAQWQICLPSEGSIDRAHVPAAIHT